MRRINRYLSLVVFAHTIFAMPFALIGFFLANQWSGYGFSWQILFLVVLCMVFARNAAMGFNRWADRKIDQDNPRTAGREIPAGKIKARSALLFTIVNSGLFIASAGLINMLCLFLSPIALLVILGYSYTKRFTRWCHLILGLGLSLAPTGAYIALSGVFHWLPILFSGLVITWVSGFDIIYSLQDSSFDREQNLKSIPSAFGNRRGLLVSVGLHSATAILVFLIGILGGFGWLYWIGSIVFVTLLIYQHTIVTSDDLTKVTRAFGTTNGIASVLYAIFVILDLFFL